MDTQNKVGFAIGTGRCGTLFLYQLLELEPAVASSHERNPDNEAFHRYCKWHGLPVDDEGFLAAKEAEISKDLEGKSYSFEASPYLSLSVRELHDRFGARFIMLVRRPDRVVSSFAHKGFYRHPYHVRDASLATGYQDTGREKVHTFFARVAPRGEFLREWNAMTQIGRVAWFWRAWNERTLALLEQLPQAAYRVIKIEDFDYAQYRQVAAFLGFDAQVGRAEFDALSQSKPHAFWEKRNIDQWSAQEVQEFESQVGELSERLGYEHRISALVGEARAERAESMAAGRITRPKPQRMWRVRQTTASFLRELAGRVDTK